MSTLVGSPAVPQSKYRILPAADPIRALEMQTGGDFRVHIAGLNEANETQIVSISHVAQARNAPHTLLPVENSPTC